jgi:CheY-like chemotaxis protein
MPPVSVGDVERLRCLVVDDNQAFSENVTEILQGFGESAVAATSGVEALRLLRLDPFDLLFSDFHMPEMNGVELTHEAHKIQPTITTVIVSAYLSAREMADADQESCSIIVEKPLFIGKLQELLNTQRTTARWAASERVPQN